MAIEWGSWSGPGSNECRVGIDLSVSGTTITAKYYVEFEFVVNDSQTLHASDALSFTDSYTYNQSGGVKLITTRTRSGSRGSTYRFDASISGVYNGGSPSVSNVSITVPALPPSTPSRPYASVQGSDSVYMSWSAPASNGAPIIEYGYRIELGGTFVDGGFNPASDRNNTFTGLDPNTTYGLRVRARNSAGWSDFSAYRYVTTDIARPASPSNLSASRVNDGRADLDWSVHGSSGAPYESQLIRRRVDGGSWQNLATVGASATSYSDTNTTDGHEYEYAVRAQNSAGYSSFAYSNTVYMTPKGPTNVSAEKDAGDIVVSWTASSSDYATGYTVYDSPDGGALVQVGTASGTSWTHVAPDPSKTHRYRVTASYSGLESYYSAWSNIVQLQAPPLAPTLLAPVDGAVHNRDSSVTFAWQHQAVDTTDQTEYELQYRIDGGAWTLLTGTTAETRQVSALSVSGTLEWQARTRGADPAFGPWSPLAVLTLASEPSVAIQTPAAGTLPASTADVTWVYQNADSDTQHSWEAELRLGLAEVLASDGASDAATQAVFDGLQDDTTYTVFVRVRSAAGLWSQWDSVEFTTDFPLPYQVTPELEWDYDTGAVIIALTDPDTGSGGTDPDAIDVERLDAGGRWVLIASGLSPGTSLVDRTPCLGAVTYRCVSRTTLPSSQRGPEVVVAWEKRSRPGISAYVNGGQGMSMVCTALGGQVSDDPDVEQSATRFAGQTVPTAIFGSGEAYTVSFTGTAVRPVMDTVASPAEDWMELQRQFRVVCYRDVTGRKVFGILRVSFSADRAVETMRLSVERTRYTEAVPRVPDSELGA